MTKRISSRQVAEKIIGGVAILAVASVLMGCANYSRKFKATNSQSLLTGTGPTSTSTPTPTPTPSPTSTSTSGSAPLYNYRAGTVGYNAVTFTVTAGRVLKVRFTPGQQDQTVVGTGYAPPYSKLGVYITVSNYQQPTPMMLNGLYGPAQNSGIMDFSSGLPTCGNNTDPNCRQQITITVDHPNYDFDCFNYGQYCPWEHVKPTHPWHGTLEVQTDDTVVLQ